MAQQTMQRRSFLRTAGGAVAAGLLSAAPPAARAAQTRPNVLFIAVDDLRPQLGCYGHGEIVSPNIDKLAAQGLVFERAYCQQAICMASRASLMSGLRPDAGHIYRDGPLYRHVPDAYPVNQHFLDNGYEAITIGKIYHHRSDEEKGWSREAHHAKGEWEGRGYLSPEAIEHVREYTRKHPNAKRRGMGPAFECADVSDDAYGDGMHLNRALEELRRLQHQTFFLAVGFVKPHLPFNCPKKYWDLYDPAKIDLADNPFAPKGAPPNALTNWGELRGYHGIPSEGSVPDELARKLIHGYYACISYVDALIGRLLAELDRLSLRDNTIIVLWGDHGWKLGEHGMWCKHTNFELDTHVPLIFSAPGMKARGKRTRALTEFVDIYPTLCELAGLELPAHLAGRSAAPLLDNPEAPWKQAAFSQYPRGNTMGYSVRTDRFRYTEWRLTGRTKVEARELYDHQTDPAENVNVADEPAHAAQIERLSALIQGNFAIPPGG